ncbi:DUF1129 family protein [Shouchella hunanensis]|uniref:DUF1129 family protein n=1 Tax=Shouchella hunanensis TaxID=766894 RepID=A0ABY7WBT5_9BACI|nr:DUF1129 family protein [Shouchella hunanensis]WDF04946.1 DUF1129 family protein [Shouchella hunanensis]GAF21103.1 hypothetical protein JCM19047_773 [Bacillus sp. JCM 19047]
MTYTEELIELNNEKREALSERNQQVYEDFLLYFRTDLRIAEQQAEELLMDILDHLLEAEKEGKTAYDLFGENPKAYAEELIAHLPREKKKHQLAVVADAFFSTLAFIFIIQGAVNGLLPLFFDFNQTISLGNALVIAIYVGFSIPLAISMVFGFVRQSLFKPDQKKSDTWMILKGGLYGMLWFVPLFLFYTFVPSFGPELSLDWWIYVVVGGLLYLILKIIKGWDKSR